MGQWERREKNAIARERVDRHSRATLSDRGLCSSPIIFKMIHCKLTDGQDVQQRREAYKGEETTGARHVASLFDRKLVRLEMQFTRTSPDLSTSINHVPITHEDFAKPVRERTRKWSTVARKAV
ncbi:hypothetical protein ACLOJK_015990 [Asimina triloba]